MYDVMTVAEYIIYRCNNLQKTISNLKLQKILYFVQAEFLVVKGLPCFQARIEAWDFGPVVPEVYQKYKVYGSTSIPCYGYCFDPFTHKDKELIDGIVDECANYSAATLVRITHNQDPWKNTYASYNNIITNESIKSYFAKA